jgi:hypothetical protein
MLRAVTKIFLGTYASRHTHRSGYWLFGFLSDVSELEMDLPLTPLVSGIQRRAAPVFP